LNLQIKIKILLIGKLIGNFLSLGLEKIFYERILAQKIKFCFVNSYAILNAVEEYLKLKKNFLNFKRVNFL